MGLAIAFFTILGLLSSCNKWMPYEYRNRIHFGELSRKRHIARANRKHSTSYGKYDKDQSKYLVDKSEADPKLLEVEALDLTYTYPGK